MHRPLTAAAAATMVLAPVDCSFEGTFRGNKFHGTGTWHGPKGENVYEGEWHFNQKDGKGVLTSPINGDTFCTIVGQIRSAAPRAAHPAPLHPAATSLLYLARKFCCIMWSLLLLLTRPGAGTYKGEWVKNNKHGQGCTSLMRQSLVFTATVHRRMEICIRSSLLRPMGE